MIVITNNLNVVCVNFNTIKNQYKFRFLSVFWNVFTHIRCRWLNTLELCVCVGVAAVYSYEIIVLEIIKGSQMTAQSLLWH